MSANRESDPYDALAPHYRDYSRLKANYLAAVDAFIIRHAPREPAALLDVGAGDGVRGMALAQVLGAHRVVLADSSVEMVTRCRQAGADEVWHCAAETLPLTDQRFDVILCLWNVLGHLPDEVARLEALRRMAGQLSPGGKLFFDVNNRHNAAAYGQWRVLWRRMIDALYPNERRGDAIFDWRIGDQVFPGMGHLFTPREIRDLIQAADLSIENAVTANYTNGELSASFFLGQMLFIVSK